MATIMATFGGHWGPFLLQNINIHSKGIYSVMDAFGVLMSEISVLTFVHMVSPFVHSFHLYTKNFIFNSNLTGNEGF